MTVGTWGLALALFGVAARAHGQSDFQVNGPDKSKATIVLRRALAGAHNVMVTDTSRRLVLPRGTDVSHTLVVVGGDASVAATVRGDVIVVGGDLFLHPGASIDGRAIAIGGGVYGSTLAYPKAGIESIRDETFELERAVGGNDTTGSRRLVYRYIGGREPRLELPLLEGLRIPSYDRVDGLSIPWGPILRPTTRLEVDPTVTYRSHVGEWDPGAIARYKLGAQYRLTLDARRTTRTNDAWIYSDLINSFNTLVGGADTRNYYRADRGEVELRRFDQYVQPALELERFIGVTTERAWSVGGADTLGGRPWSAFGRTDPEKLARGNPPVERGRISSAFVGALARYHWVDVRMTALARLEVPWRSPGEARFGQITFDGTIQFPTFGVQRFRTDVHLVATVGDSAPPQRYVYLGGTGTLPVMDEPLSMGGDQLLHIDSRYEIPLPRLTMPFLGPPTVSIRHRIGSAGVGRLPRFVQNVGPLVTLSFVRLEYTIDPATSDSRFKLGLSFAR
jgi:hypothetical protein